MSIVTPSSNNGNSNGTPVNRSSMNGRPKNGNGVYSQNHVAAVEAARSEYQLPANLKHSWLMGKLASRLACSRSSLRIQSSNIAPRVGDCIIGKISKVGNHSRLFTEDNQYSRIYQNDFVAGIIGSRYATDAYHAMRIDPSNLHLLTNGGLMGTVCSQHSSMKSPTKIDLMGYLVDGAGNRINSKETLFRPIREITADVNPVFTVGTGMNSGKTTSTARLGQALVSTGHKVAILKLTGSASHRDIHEFNATGAAFAADFSDYGFPSTYLARIDDLERLYCRMMADASACSPDVVLIEIADGVYQRETEALLNSKLIKSTTSGAVLTAACAASAIAIDQSAKQFGWDPIAVTGLITNSPLFVQEFSLRSDTPVCDTGKGIQDICDLIMSRIQARKLAALQTF